MPILSSFTGIAARGFGFTNGLQPTPPTSISFTPSALNAVVTFTTTPTSYPINYVQAKIMQGATLISNWATVTSGGNISASNLTPGSSYTVYFRTHDTGGQVSEETSESLTTSAEVAPTAPTFSVSPSAGNAGTFKFEITYTAGSAGTYTRSTQYRIETAGGTQLVDWTTTSSSPISYGATTYNGAGALTPSTTYKVRMRSVAATSGTITYAAYQTVTTNAAVAPGNPSFSSGPSAAASTAGEFSFTFAVSNGSANSYPVSATQYRVRSGTSTYVTGYDSWQTASGTVTVGTSTYSSAILTPGSTYYVDIRTIDDRTPTPNASSTVTGTVTLTSRRSIAAGSVAVDPPTYSSGSPQSTVLNVVPSSFSAGSYPIDYYQYSFDNSTWSTLSGNQVSGLSANTSYTIYVRAIDTAGFASSSVSDSGTTNSPVPAAPTLSWRSGMSNSYVGDTYLFLSAPSYYQTAYVVVNSSTFNSSTHSGYFSWTGSGWNVSIPVSFNSSYSIYGYVTNKHGTASSNSSTRTWNTVSKGVAWSVVDGTEVYCGRSDDPPTGACAGANYRIGINLSGIPSNDYEVGYVTVTTISAQLKGGSTFNPDPTGYTTAWKIPSGTEYTDNLSANLDVTYAASGNPRQKTGLSISGANANGTFYLRTPAIWAKTISGAYGCLPYNGDYIIGKEFTLSGTQTTAGSYS
jgi:hypothetical protein